MYLSTISRRTSTGDTGRSRWTAVSGNVFALGAVSLTTDVSAEMVTAVLPLYLVVGLQLSPLAYGVLDGLHTGATVVLRLVGGYIADRIRRRKAVAGCGYGLSAVAKLGLLAAGSSATAIGLALGVDRAGKGLRTAPRDALITLSTTPDGLGRAFGVHRSMDAVGAFIGPVAAFAVLGLTGQAYDAVFVTSFCIASLGVLMLALFVRDQRQEQPARQTASLREAAQLLRRPPVGRLLAAACLLGLATVGDGFVYLLVQRRENLAIGWFPLMAVGTALVYLLLATPMGALADRFGRLPVVTGGYAALGIVYLLIYGPLRGWPLLVTMLTLHGLFYAATDGVLMALAGPVVPEHLRATGLALIQSGQAVAYLVSSILFGLAWQVCGPVVASRIAACGVVVAIGATLLLLRTAQTTRARSEEP